MVGEDGASGGDGHGDAGDANAAGEGNRDGDGAGARATLPRKLLDAVQYAVAVTVAAAAVSAVPSVLLGAGLVGVKYGLFVLGFLAFGYASFLLQPVKPWKDGSRWRRNRDEPTPFQRAVRRLPPAAWFPVDPEDRFGRGAKLFLASLTMLATSYVMEAVFGVAA